VLIGKIERWLARRIKDARRANGSIGFNHAALPTPVLYAMDDNLSAEHFYERGMTARRQGDDDEAFACFVRANSLIVRFGPVQNELRVMSEECLRKAEGAANGERLRLLVRALEMNPLNREVRNLVEAMVSQLPGEDLTKMCFIFYDGNRARAIHEEAYKRALEFVTIGGVVGDVMEFGVLGGWSSRIFCEVMRDIFNLSNIHLFDSFEGLPEYESQVDQNSYEIAGRNVWSDKMKFPDDLLRRFGQPHHLHIREKLAEVIRAERIFVHKGFYSETLKNPPKVKASIVHLDCDLYQSTMEIFENLLAGNCFQDGTVLLFDDWNCNKANPNFGQRRALRDFLSAQNDFDATPWFTYGYNGATYILHDKSQGQLAT
jgi:O-methyltransferase